MFDSLKKPALSGRNLVFVFARQVTCLRVFFTHVFFFLLSTLYICEMPRVSVLSLICGLACRLMAKMRALSAVCRVRCFFFSLCVLRTCDSFVAFSDPYFLLELVKLFFTGSPLLVNMCF
jgi:hypothetical protein